MHRRSRSAAATTSLPLDRQTETFAGGPATLVKGETFVLDGDPAPGDTKRAYLPHPEIVAAAEPGHVLLLDDGKIRLIATEVGAGRIITRVEVGGKLSDRKGVS